MLSGILDFFDNKHIERINNDIKLYGGSYRDISVKCRTINSILSEHNLYEIDYCSIDTEGAEYMIMKNFNFEKYNVKVFTIENNANRELRLLLKRKGYRHISGEADDYFLRKDVPGFFRVMILLKYYKFTHWAAAKIHHFFHKLKKSCWPGL